MIVFFFLWMEQTVMPFDSYNSHYLSVSFYQTKPMSGDEGDDAGCAVWSVYISLNSWRRYSPHLRYSKILQWTQCGIPTYQHLAVLVFLLLFFCFLNQNVFCWKRGIISQGLLWAVAQTVQVWCVQMPLLFCILYCDTGSYINIYFAFAFNLYIVTQSNKTIYSTNRFQQQSLLHHC